MVLPQTAQAYQGLCAPCHREAVSAAKVKAVAEQPKPKKVLLVDEDAFDECEKHFIREIVSSLKSTLEGMGFPESRLHDATYDLSFCVAAALDNCAGMMQPGGEPLIPVLTFAKDPECGELVARRGGTYMHESVCEIVNEVFREQAS